MSSCIASARATVATADPNSSTARGTRRYPPSLTEDRRGAVALLAAVGMTALLGMAAFAIDLGAAYAQRAALQKVADSAAMAGAISWVKAGSATAATTTVKDVVLANGWPASVIQSTTAPTTANPQVTVSLAAAFMFSFGKVLSAGSSVTTTGYSVASVKSGSAAACLVALSTLMVNGTVNVNGCAASANSTSSSAITVNGGGSLTASSIDTPGGVVKNGTVVGTVKTGAAAASDPFSSYQSQANSGFTNCQSTSQTTLSTSGCYSNINVNSGTTLTLNPGVYFFPGINVNGGTISGPSGVTIVIQNQFSPSGNLAITAPTSGPWAGMAIYAIGGMNANSPITYNIDGAMYSPSNTITLNSGTWNQGACTYIVASTITVNSNANFTLPQNNCGQYNYPASGVSSGAATIALVQ